VLRTCTGCVLLVDDEASVRNVLSAYFENAGFRVIHAEDGIDALVKLRDTLPKVIIADLEMPRMSGFEFIGVVRRRFPTIPVIALTGALPTEFPGDIKPDYLLEKNGHRLSDLVQAVSDLTQKTPECPDLPQVVTTPVRARPALAGYFELTCPDCLRTFSAPSRPENKGAGATAACTHCEAHVPFLMDY